jgi:hypothetical protein
MAFKDGTVGNTSQKSIRQQRRLLYEKVRNELIQKRETDGLKGIMISDYEVKKCIYYQIIQTNLMKLNNKKKSNIFTIFKNILEYSKLNEKKAYNMLLHKYAGKCFYKWSDWTYLVGKGLNRKMWSGPRKYEVSYYYRIHIQYYITLST